MNEKLSTELQPLHQQTKDFPNKPVVYVTDLYGVYDEVTKNNKKHEINTNFKSLQKDQSVETSIEQEEQKKQQKKEQKKKAFQSQGNYKQFFGNFYLHHMLFLALVGTGGAVISYTSDLITENIYIQKQAIANNQEYNYWYRYMFWIASSCFFMFLSACMGEYISRDAEGSGVPEIKSIVAGLSMPRYFSWNSFIAKYCGIILSISVGFPLGRRGSFTHMTSIVTKKLSELKMFSDIGTNQTLLKQMLIVAISVGTAATFHAPFGGVLFSMEMINTYYMVGILWKSFFAGTISVIVLKTLFTLPLIKPNKHTQYPLIPVDHEVIFVIILSVFLAQVAAWFNHVLTKLIYLRVKIKQPFIAHRWKYCMSVGLFVAIVSYPPAFMRINEKRILDQMYGIQNIDELQDGRLWTYPSMVLNMIVHGILKFIYTVLDVSCPIVFGVFAPMFSLGAVWGRLYGHLLRRLGNYLGIQLVKYEGIYALAGSVALGGSVTKTISVGIIVLELTGQINTLIPVLVAAMASHFCNSTMSVFEVLLELKNLPYMATLGSIGAYRFRAYDIMNRNFFFLTKDAKLADIPPILQRIGYKNLTVPVVESKIQKSLLHTVQAQSLRKYLYEHYQIISTLIDSASKGILDQYFESLNGVLEGRAGKTNFTIDPLSINRPSIENQQISSQGPSNEQIIETFWNTQIDFNDPQVQIDYSPFIVMEDTSLSKIHYLFVMLNLSQLTVLKKGIIQGIITKHEFLTKRREVPDSSKSQVVKKQSKDDKYMVMQNLDIINKLA